MCTIRGVPPRWWLVRRHVGLSESSVTASADLLATCCWEILYVKLKLFDISCKGYVLTRPVVMFGAFVAGWGLPAVALVIALVFSGVSFRFGGKNQFPFNLQDVKTDF